MRILTEKVKALAKEWGADLVGVAPIERLTTAPSPFRPDDILPQVKAILSLAVRLNRTIQEVNLLGRSGIPFSRFGGSAPDDRLDQIALQVANFLEDMGYPSCPLPGWSPTASCGRSSAADVWPA